MKMQLLTPDRFIISLLKKGLLFLLLVLYMKAAIAQVSSLPPLLLQTADSLYQTQQWSQAKEKYMQFLKDSANKPMYWQRLGYCNHHLGLYKEAISNYQIRIERNHPHYR